MSKGGVGVPAKCLQRGEGQRVAGEGRDDAGGKLGVGQASEGTQVRGREMRPGFGHVEAAVFGKAGEEDAGEVERGGLAAGGDVVHQGKQAVLF